MFCAHLQLAEFRNYAQLDCALPAGISVIQGANGSGKTSLLEAIYLLATTRSPALILRRRAGQHTGERRSRRAPVRAHCRRR